MESARRPLKPPSRERPTRERAINRSRTLKNQLYGNSVAKKLALFSQSLSRSDRLSRERPGDARALLEDTPPLDDDAIGVRQADPQDTVGAAEQLVAVWQRG